MAKKIEEQPDFLGVKLAMNDLVAFSQSESSTLALGKVVGFTAKGVRVIPIPMPNTRIKVGYGWNGETSKHITRTLNQVVKLPAAIQELSDLPSAWLQEVFK